MTWEPAMIMVDMRALSPSGAHLASMEVMQGKVPASQQPIRNLNIKYRGCLIFSRLNFVL